MDNLELEKEKRKLKENVFSLVSENLNRKFEEFLDQDNFESRWIIQRLKYLCLTLVRSIINKNESEIVN
jgi:hypothetical protein